MKITIERLREIITEEVIKEELAPEIAAPAIAAMLQGMEAEVTSDVFGDVFNQMYGEGALDAEAERQANAEEPEPEMRQPIGFDREPEEALATEPGQMGFRENINEIIQEEYYLYIIEKYQKTLNEALTGKSHSDYLRAKYADVTPEDPYAKYAGPGPEDDPKYYKAAPRADRDPLLGPKTSRALRVATIQVAQLAETWRDLINQGVDMRAVIDRAKSEGVDTLQVLMNVHQMIQDTYNKQGHGEYTPAPDEQKFTQPKDPRSRAISDDDYDYAARMQKRDAQRRRQAASTYSLEEMISEAILELNLEF